MFPFSTLYHSLLFLIQSSHHLDRLYFCSQIIEEKVERKVAVAEHEATDEAMMKSGNLREGLDGGGGNGGNQKELNIVALHDERQRRGGSKAARDGDNG